MRGADTSMRAAPLPLVLAALALLAAGAALVPACGSPRLSLRPTEHTFTASDYGSILSRWTDSRR